MSFKSPGPHGSGPRLLDPNQRLRLFDDDEELPDGLEWPDQFVRQPGFDLGSPSAFTPGPLLAQMKFVIAFEMHYRRWAQDNAEFELINAYDVGHVGNYRPFANLKEYLAYRDKYFGSRDEYLRFAAESDKELSGKVREIINPPDRRLPPVDAEKAKAVFYRWVRKAYQKKFKVDDVAADLEERQEDYRHLERLVKAEIREKLQPAFCPRPERKQTDKYRYILGTISDHARGLAVDIDPAHNPDVPGAAWKFILKYTGMAFDRGLNRWLKDAEGLTRDVRRMSDQFGARIGAEVALVTKYQSLLKGQPGAKSVPDLVPIPFGHGMAQSKAGYLLQQLRGAGKDPTPASGIEKYIRTAGTKFLDADPLDVVLDTALSGYEGDKPEKKTLRALVPGFFTLSAETVQAFRTYGFTWGITFPQPDLMHFARDGQTPPAMGDFNASHGNAA